MGCTFYIVLYGNLTAVVPPPRDLEIERQLNSSVVIKWAFPKGIATKDIKGYTIYVDKQFRQTVLGSARTKSLVTDLPAKVIFLCVCN